ncbi:MAG: metal ABC transporter permease, partial [Verrucomicrobiaceae bacterium]
MQDILTYPFFQRALLGALIIGFTNGCFSAYVVLRRSALVAGSLSHALLPGIAAGILVSGALTAWSAFLGAMIAALLVVLGSLAVARSSRLDQGTALAVIFTIAFAVGLILLKYVPVQVKLEDYLFGDILNISSSDLWVTFGISVFTLVLTTALQRPILLTLFEPSVAAAQGVPVRALNYLIMTLLVLVMVSSLQAVGCILALGLVVAPGATVFLLTNSTRAMFWA